jgi:hypothetical protein
MNFLICSKVSIPARDRTLPCWEYLRSLGHTVEVCHPHKLHTCKPDVIISMGVTIMEETFQAIARFPDAKLFCYNWDCYEWVWSNPRPGEYDYKRYGELLKLATEIWVPSYCTGQRTTQWWRLNNWHRVLSACPWWDYDNVRDGGYILCCLREIPDPQWDWFERACKEANLPYKMTMHEQSYEAYQDAVAGCRFIVAHMFELSTGGLSLMEAYYHGKPCLINDSEWNGGKDYMGERATYFDSNNFDDLIYKLNKMYTDPLPVMSDHKEHITENFSDQRMVDDMLARIAVHV